MRVTAVYKDLTDGKRVITSNVNLGLNNVMKAIKNVGDDKGEMVLDIEGRGNEGESVSYIFNDILSENSYYSMKLISGMGNRGIKDIEVEGLVFEVEDRHEVYYVRSTMFPQFNTTLDGKTIKVREYVRIDVNEEDWKSMEEIGSGRGIGMFIKDLGINRDKEDRVKVNVLIVNNNKEKIEHNMEFDVNVDKIHNINVKLEIFEWIIWLISEEHWGVNETYINRMPEWEKDENMRIGYFVGKRRKSPDLITQKGQAVPRDGRLPESINDVFESVVNYEDEDVGLVYNLLYTYYTSHVNYHVENIIKGLVDTLNIGVKIEKHNLKDKEQEIVYKKDDNSNYKILERVLKRYENRRINIKPVGRNDYLIKEYMGDVGVNKSEFLNKMKNVRNNRTHEGIKYNKYSYSYNESKILMTLTRLYVFELMEMLGKVELNKESQ